MHRFVHESCSLTLMLKWATLEGGQVKKLKNSGGFNNFPWLGDISVCLCILTMVLIVWDKNVYACMVCMLGLRAVGQCGYIVSMATHLNHQLFEFIIC